MNHRAVLLLLAGLALAVLAPAPAEAQIPGLLRPGAGGGRPAGPPRPPGRDAGRDTLPGDSARRERQPAPPDTLVDRLLQLEGYTAIEYQGDSAEYRRPERTLRLRGNPQVTRGETVLTATDSIVYRENSDVVAAYGRPEVTGQGEPLASDQLFYNLATERATAIGARTRITNQATWLVEGDVNSEQQGRRLFAQNSTFTTDDREVPAYHFRADRIMVLRDRVLIGRPAYLYFRNVPVMALPFIVQDLARGRRSGVLVPEFEINDIIRTSSGRLQRGTGREISRLGYYFALNEYLGLSVAGRWRSDSYSALQSDLDFNWRRRFLNGSFAFERFWRTTGERSFNLNGSGAWQPTERMDLRLSANYASSSRFERYRTTDPYRQTAEVSSSLSFTRRMDWADLSAGMQARQSLANDDMVLTPSVTLGLRSWAPFPVRDGANPTLLNEVVINPGGVSLTGSRVMPGAGQRRPDQANYNAGFSPSISIGDFSVGTGAQYTFTSVDTLLAVTGDTAGIPAGRLGAFGGSRRETLDLSASTGYQISLIGSTRLNPSISLSRRYLRADTALVPDDLDITEPQLADSLAAAYGRFVGAAPRVNLGATLATDLYGFFPGIGEYSAIRHHLRPSVTYTYSPPVRTGDGESDRVRRILFGRYHAGPTNEMSLRVNQTFEAKVRTPRPVGGDSLADSARAAGNRAQPQDARKITLLALDTDAVQYTFAPTDDQRYRFRTEKLSNTITSDLFGGLRFSMSHDLFADRVERDAEGQGRLVRGAFNPYLESVQTFFSFGQNSAFLRWLGFNRANRNAETPQDEGDAQTRGRTPDAEGIPTTAPSGNATGLSNNQQMGGGAWNAQVNYSLSRTRPSAADTIPGLYQRGNQQLNGSLTFTPTENWAVSWNTGYSLSTGEFDTHVLNFQRDLYRWQANFTVTRTPLGNTTFSFRVNLIDLPELKADYNESYFPRADEGGRQGGLNPDDFFFQRAPVNPRRVPR